MFPSSFFPGSFFPRTFFPSGAAAAGVTYELTALHGTFLTSGQSAGLNALRVLGGLHGAFATGGQSAVLSIVAAPEEITFDGPSGPYDLGDLVRIAAIFTKAAGENADPDEVTISVRRPDGVVVAYESQTDVELVRAAEGIYYVDWLCAMAGKHLYRLVAEGAVQSAEEADFFVNESGFN